MTNSDKQLVEDFFDGKRPTYDEIVAKLRHDGEFVGFALGELFARHPEMLVSDTGDGISVEEAQRRINDGSL